MNNEHYYEESFTNSTSVTKTLANELRPTYWTCKHIRDNGILLMDELRNKETNELKSIMDDYYRKYIDDKLSCVHSLNWKELFAALDKMFKEEKSGDAIREYIEKERALMRDKLYKLLSDDEKFKLMFTGKFVTKILPEFVRNNDAYDEEQKEKKINTLELFGEFTTAVGDFFNNRKNVFSKDAKHTAICYRVVDENFTIFYRNIVSYKKIVDNAPGEIEKIELENKNRLGEWQLSHIYTHEFYNEVLIQKGIEYYNDICGMINSHMNLYCQQTKEKSGQYRMRKLHKQILSTTSTSYEVPYMYKDDTEVYNSINLMVDKILTGNFSDKIKGMLEKSSEYDFNKIYVSSKTYGNISNFMCGTWSLVESCIRNYYEDNTVAKADKKQQKVEDRIKKEKYRSLHSIDKVVEMYDKEKVNRDAKDYIYYIEEIYDEKKLKKIEADNQIKLVEDDKKIENIKEMLDMLLNTKHFLGMFDIDDSEDLDSGFYSEIDGLIEVIDGVEKLYNRVRNYVTKKPYNKGKIRLNFNSPTLASGWSKSKEYASNAIILRREGKYYLAIFNVGNKPDKKIMEGYRGEVGDGYEKMVYSLLPGANKMLPKVFLSKKGIDKYKPSQYILDSYSKERHLKSSKNFDINFCHDLIDYFKKSINANEDWKVFDFKFSDTNSYEDIGGFYREVEEQGYKISWVNIARKDIEKLDEDGQIYLFQIYNKDFSDNSTGTPNLHTLYFKNLFSEENMKQTVLKLNGEAELFFRKAGIEKPIVHKKGSILVNKTYKTMVGNEEVRVPIPDKEYMELYTYFQNGETTSLSENAIKLLDSNAIEHFAATMDITKDRRFTADKFFIYTSIVINYKAKQITDRQLNEQVLDYISKQDDMHIIGIDRGERNLVYVSVIDMKGKIVEQKSYNIVNNYNFQKKLVEREKERDKARKSWKEVGKITDLKEGYLSLVVHEIADMVVKYNAIIAMEDLNYGFKRGRFKIERQVYQKFESMLIKKMNYLVDKKKKVNEPGGLLKGYQLTYIPKEIKKVGRQCGIIFYVPPAYTSKIDPATGFVNVFKFKSDNQGGGVKARNSKKEFISKLDDIRYIDSDKYGEPLFSFTFDYDNFITHDTVLAKRKWTAYTFGSRIKKVFENEKYTRKSQEIKLTSEMRKILEENKIEYRDGHNLIEDIQKADDDVVDGIFNIFRLTVQMRNSMSEAENCEYDRLISPIMNSDGVFFDSFVYKNINEKSATSNNTASMPIDADANGAYCIAMKCLLEAKRIKLDWGKSSKNNNTLLIVTNADWFDFMQNKRYL